MVSIWTELTVHCDSMLCQLWTIPSLWFMRLLLPGLWWPSYFLHIDWRQYFWPTNFVPLSFFFAWPYVETICLIECLHRVASWKDRFRPNPLMSQACYSMAARNPCELPSPTITSLCIDVNNVLVIPVLHLEHSLTWRHSKAHICKISIFVQFLSYLWTECPLHLLSHLFLLAIVPCH